MCKDPTYAAVFDKCETANCTAAEQTGTVIPLLPFTPFVAEKSLIVALTVTNAYAISICAQVGGFGHNNTTVSSTAASISGTAAPTGTTTNGTFRGSPVPFTSGSDMVRVCGAVVLAGLSGGGLAIAL